MERKLIINFDGRTFLFNGPVEEGIAAAAKMIPVNSQGYGKSKKWIVNNSDEVSFEVIAEERVVDTEVESENSMKYLKERIEALEKSSDDYQNRAWKAERELKAANETIDKFKTESETADA